MIDGHLDSDSRSVTLDFKGLTIRSVRMDGHKAKFTRLPHKLTVLDSGLKKKGALFHIEVQYDGKPVQSQSQALPPGMTSGWIHYSTGVAAVCEPDLAHTWFPCNDHPLNKAKFTFDITVPNGYIAIANGIGSAKGHTFHYDLDTPTQTCMATVVVGKFDIITQEGPSGIKMVSYAPSGTGTRLKGQIDCLPGYIQFLTNLLGPFPYKSYGIVVLPNEAGTASSLLAASALETTTIPIYGPGAASANTVLMHELTHQWMGNCVSATKWGDDIWGIEGFAQYSEWLLAEHDRGKDAYEQQASDAYRSIVSAGSWLKPGHLTVQDMFSERSYIGGAITFYALRKAIGDDAFFRTIRRFLNANRNGNGTTADWVRAASQEAGHDMKSFFETWLNGDKVPQLPK